MRSDSVKRAATGADGCGARELAHELSTNFGQ
jgi:hypothetical protein